MLVLGIDGMSYEFVINNLHHLPHIDKMYVYKLNNYNYLDYCSPALWSYIYSGIKPDEIMDAKLRRKGHLFNPNIVKDRFIWHILEKKGFSVSVVNCCIRFPPVSYNTYFKPIGHGIPINEKEMQTELDTLYDKAKELIDYDFVCLNTHVIDSIQHINEFTVAQTQKESKNKHNSTLKVYGMVDEWIGHLQHLYSEIVSVSDHGFYHPGYNHAVVMEDDEIPRAFEVHHPHGTLMSTFELGEMNIDAVYSMLLRRYNG